MIVFASREKMTKTGNPALLSIADALCTLLCLNKVILWHNIGTYHMCVFVSRFVAGTDSRWKTPAACLRIS